MVRKEQNQLFEEAYHLQNCELAIGELYQQLSEKLPEEKMFWQEAVSNKVKYAMLIGRIISMICSRPVKFSQGKFRVALLETFLAGVYEQIDLIHDNKVPMPQIYKTILDYESSVVMTKPYDIVQSYDFDFRNLKELFEEEISAHSAKIKQYLRQKLGIAQVKSPSPSAGFDSF